MQAAVKWLGTLAELAQYIVDDGEYTKNMVYSWYTCARSAIQRMHAAGCRHM